MRSLFNSIVRSYTADNGFMLDLSLVAAAVVALAAVFLIVQRLRRAQRPSIRRFGFGTASMMALVGCTSVMGLGYRFWYFHRPLPSETRQTLFEGVTYIREVRSDPRSMIIHVWLVDLNAPGISFLVTPGQPSSRGNLRARTTSQFLKEFGVQVAINGGDFTPWYSRTILDYYPRVGDPVRAVGFTSSRGDIYSTTPSRLPTLYISADNQASFQQPIGAIYNAISGLFMIVKDGQWVPSTSRNGNSYGGLHPRTVLALDKNARTLILIVVDGRQPNYSEGATLEDLGDIAFKYGAYNAMNQDGGGSSAMVIQGKSGAPELLNSPIDVSIPGRERAIGNHLGIFARPLNP